MLSRSQARRVQQDRTQSAHIQAPILGMDTVSAGLSMPAGYSIYSYNLIGAEHGLRSRLGWREWVTGLNDEQVRSLLPFTGSTADSSANRLFACTTTGIWDVSASTTTPTQVVTFATANESSGYGTSVGFVNDSGNHFLVYTDEVNGAYFYTEATATWTAGGIAGSPITGVDASRLVWVASWGNRLWFVEKDSATSWYTGVRAVSGALTAFRFGSRFAHGGDLRCLSSWTGDGGSGMDDKLVAIGGGGDVVIYKGTDPSSASTFELAGVWFTGSVPAGRRLTTDSGGEMLLMSSTGIQSLAKLVIGGAAFSTQYQTAKISNLFQRLQSETANKRGWAMRLHPKDGCLMTLVPGFAAAANQQLVMSLSTQGWHQYRDMPVAVCAESWNGELYFGTEDGRVCYNAGDVDGVLLADPDSFAPIYWSALTGFSNMGSPTQKQIHQLRPTLMSQGGNIPYEIAARYRWDLSEIPSISAVPSSGGARWGSALWDQAVWGGSFNASQPVHGAYGMGPEVAIAIRGAASARMIWAGVDCRWENGGFL